MKLNYRLAHEPTTASTDVSSLSEDDFRYAFALGDVIFQSGSVDLSARWGWVPLIDFALSLRAIREAVGQGAWEETYHFTESDAVVYFRRREDEIIVSASYAPGEIRMAVRLFDRETVAFEKNLARDLLEMYPALARNDWFKTEVLAIRPE
jgi:hypothetical protein